MTTFQCNPPETPFILTRHTREHLPTSPHLPDSLYPVRNRKSRRKGRTREILNSSRGGIAPNAPGLVTAHPEHSLEDNVFGAILGCWRGLVGRSSGLSGAAFGLAGCDADYGLANAGVGHFWEKCCAVRENSDTSEEGGGGAAVALE